MSFAEEIAALAAAPFAWLRLRRRGAVFVTLYALCAGAVLALVASLLVSHEGDVKAALVTYLFPQSWTAIASFLIDRF
ncbi:MAG: hypothetical protein KAI47_17015, partial [Deltaproteobacteria bacterium]|nr:hypothetical protein [Deltaproteobacteria bacterium]